MSRQNSHHTAKFNSDDAKNTEKPEFRRDNTFRGANQGLVSLSNMPSENPYLDRSDKNIPNKSETDNFIQPNLGFTVSNQPTFGHG